MKLLDNLNLKFIKIMNELLKKINKNQKWSYN